MTKKEMVLRIVELYGRGSKMAMFFAGIATNFNYAYTRKIYFIILKKHLDK